MNVVHYCHEPVTSEEGGRSVAGGRLRHSHVRSSRFSLAADACMVVSDEPLLLTLVSNSRWRAHTPKKIPANYGIFDHLGIGSRAQVFFPGIEEGLGNTVLYITHFWKMWRLSPLYSKRLICFGNLRMGERFLELRNGSFEVRKAIFWAEETVPPYSNLRPLLVALSAVSVGRRKDLPISASGQGGVAQVEGGGVTTCVSE